MLDAMSSTELTMWQAFFVEDAKRHEERDARRRSDRELLGEDP